MVNAARWIRLGPIGASEMHAACEGLAKAQAAHAAPIVLWARTSAPMLGDLIRVEETHFAFVLIVPFRLAPGRTARWRAWGLAPALATYRHFGLRAYLDDGAVCLHGQRIGESRATAIGGCAVVASSFLPQLVEKRAGCAERNLVAVFRSRLEAQHGWQFDDSWPSAGEKAAIADAFAVEGADAA